MVDEKVCKQGGDVALSDAYILIHEDVFVFGEMAFTKRALVEEVRRGSQCGRDIAAHDAPTRRRLNEQECVAAIHLNGVGHLNPAARHHNCGLLGDSFASCW